MDGGSSTSGCTTGGTWTLINSLSVRSPIIMYHDLVNISMPANGIDKILASSTIFCQLKALCVILRLDQSNFGF
jgi:hypothetical protein